MPEYFDKLQLLMHQNPEYKQFSSPNWLNLLLWSSLFFYIFDALFKIYSAHTIADYDLITSPVFLKWGRDLSLIFLLAIFCIKLCKKRHMAAIASYLSLILILTAGNPVVQTLAGLKIFAPLLVFLCPITNQSYFLKISRKSWLNALKFTFFLHLALQVLNLIFGAKLHGVNLLGLSSRSVGLDPSPAVSGLLTIVLFHALNIIESRFSNIRFFLTIISVGLSSSIMALLLLALSICFYFSKIRHGLRYVLIGATLGFVFLTHFSRHPVTDVEYWRGYLKNPSSLTSAPATELGYIKESGGKRWTLFKESAVKLIEPKAAHLMMPNFGLQSSWGYSVRKGTMGESLYTAVMQNLNLPMFLLLLTVCLYLLFESRQQIISSRNVTFIHILFWISAITLITTELLFLMVVLIVAKSIALSSEKEY